MTMAKMIYLLLAAEPSWRVVETAGNLVLESRDVPGSRCAELRVKSQSKASVERLCAEAFGDGKLDADDGDLKARAILKESQNERTTYDQISPPLVAKRDYAVTATRKHFEDGSCTMSFVAANEMAPALPAGWIRITTLKGAWKFTPTPSGNTQIEYVIHTDPGGSVPTFLIEGARKKAAIRWMKMTIAKAERPSR
jgi:hypothetical protein